MLKLRLLGKFDKNYRPEEMVYCHKHNLVFLRYAKRGVVIIDSEEKKEIGTHSPSNDHVFVDMELTPSRDYLYVADRQDRNPRNDEVADNYVHRYDLKARKWEKRLTPTYTVGKYQTRRINAQYVRRTRIGSRTIRRQLDHIAALDDRRVVGSGKNKFAIVSWQNGEEMSHVASIKSKGHRFDYDPRTGYAHFSPTNRNSVRGNWLFDASPSISKDEEREFYKEVRGHHEVGLLLSTNGKFMYFGHSQFETPNPLELVRNFPEPIFAASDDIAFGHKAYYNAHTGEKIDKWGREIHAHGIATSLDGARVCVTGVRGTHFFAIEGEK